MPIKLNNIENGNIVPKDSKKISKNTFYTDVFIGYVDFSFKYFFGPGPFTHRFHTLSYHLLSFYRITRVWQ